jgi:polar amino acid transport system permease protein
MIGPDGALAPERSSRWARAPWWLLALALGAGLVGWKLLADALWRDIAGRLLDGVGVTLAVTAVAFPLAFAIGLVAALGLVSARPWARQVATLYVQVTRGLPVLVQIFLVAFVVTPLAVEGLRGLGEAMHGWWGLSGGLAELRAADVPMAARVVVALALAYGAFEAETLRAGLTSLSRGQAEAARALGLSRGQALRRVLLPQTFRRVLPTLGNDLICLLKDSALVSVLGVRDVTQEARLYQSATFRYLESLVLLACVYLALTLLVAAVVRALEKRYRRYAA